MVSILLCQHTLPAQWLVPADTLNSQRLYTGLGIAAITYGTFTLGLNYAWYADHDRSRFHLFNDSGEWMDMDKFGHAYSSYFQSQLVFHGARWTGLDERRSLWTGISTSLLFQSTIEVMDGFSDKWGFSIPDMAFNLGGVALFGLQQQFWHEQRIILKMSSFPRSYSDEIVKSDQNMTEYLSDRATDLYGRGFSTRLLKDYNAQTVWLSVNPRSFMSEASWLPPWLNLALGVGAENLYGGFENSWANELGTFTTDRPRYQQYFLSMDIDLTRIKTNDPFLKSLLRLLNIIKVPFPTLEYNPEEGLIGHWVHF